LRRDVTLINTDCAKALRVLDATSVDAVVTDPPYEIAFNGSKWDSTGIAYDVDMWGELHRVVKPGAYLLAFGGTRTFHRMTSAIEDAGFEIQDCLAWLYGNGFPKHRSKLKPAWEPIVLARRKAPHATLLNIDGCQDNGRWPANVVLDEIAAELLDSDAAGVKPSRFFYIAKATPEEKDAGLAGAGLRKKSSGLLAGLKTPSKARFNHHPTVKPIALMQRLVRLITPVAGVVADPFGGTFTTGCAAMLEGRSFLGIEREKPFFRIGEQRVRHWKEVALRGH
jgi:DNA modification methylase